MPNFVKFWRFLTNFEKDTTKPSAILQNLQFFAIFSHFSEMTQQIPLPSDTFWKFSKFLRILQNCRGFCCVILHFCQNLQKIDEIWHFCRGICCVLGPKSAVSDRKSLLETWGELPEMTVLGQKCPVTGGLFFGQIWTPKWPFLTPFWGPLEHPRSRISKMSILRVLIHEMGQKCYLQKFLQTKIPVFGHSRKKRGEFNG